MGYIGSLPSDLNSGAKPRNDFTGDGATLNFTLSQSVPGGFESNVLVIVDNVIQQPLEAYTITGSNYTTLTFSEAPASGAVIYVLHQGNATNFIAPSTGSVGASALADNLRNFTVDTFTGNGSTAAFTLTDTPISANSILVIVDGIIQTRTTNYTLATNVVTFTGAPDSGSAITVIHLGFSTVSRTGVVDGSITTAKIADNAITSDKIADLAVTGAKLVDGSVANGKIANGTITAAKFATGQTPSFNGITFPATQSASSNANTLDDYEEGTWTPVLGASITNPTGMTYSFQSGSYVKVGRLVQVEFIMALTSKGTGGSGAIQVNGLPFTHANQNVYATATGTVAGLQTNLTSPYLQINTGSNYLVCLYGNGTTSPQAIDYATHCNYNTDVRGTLCYVSDN